MKAKKNAITAMVPAKLGSTRLYMKNLALIKGKPLIGYAIEAARKAGIFDRIVVNAEDTIFQEIAKRYEVDFYLRPKKIVDPKTKTDTVVYDFLLKNPCDIVAWVSPIAPLQSPEEIRCMAEFFEEEGLDSLMTVKDEQVHCVYKDKPVNFTMDEIFAQTQDLIPIKAFVYSIMMWRSDAFMKSFRDKGYATLCGKVGYFTVSKPSSIIVKKQEDLMLADFIKRATDDEMHYKAQYDSIIENIRKAA